MTSWQDKIAISTSDPNRPKLEVPVNVSEVPSLRIVPRIVCLKQTTEDPEPTATVQIRPNRKGVSLTVSDIKNPDWLEVKNDVDQEGLSTRLHVKVTRKGVISGSILNGKIAVIFAENELSANIPVLLFAQE